MLIVLMDLLVYCSNSLPSSSLLRKINALTEKPRVFLNNQEMMAAMMEGMPLRQLLSFVPGIKREMLEQMVGALNEGFAYNKKKCINGNESLMPVTELPSEIVDKIEAVGMLESIPLWIVTLLGSLLITVLSFVMILTVYGRMFKLYMYTAIAPIPLATFAHGTRARGIK